MAKRAQGLVAVMVLSCTLLPAQETQEGGAEALAKAVVVEEAEGNLMAAAKLYRQVAEGKTVTAEVRTQARWRLGLLLVRGWYRGFVREAMDLVGLVFGTILAFRLGPAVGVVVEAMSGMSSDASRFTGWMVVFLATGVGAALATRAIERRARLPGLNLMNRVGGAGRCQQGGQVHDRVASGRRRGDRLAVGDIAADPLDLGGALRADDSLQNMAVVVQVEENRAVGPVHFESLERLVATGVAGAFEGAHAAIGEAGEQHAGVVYADGRKLAGVLVHPLLNESLGCSDYAADRAVEPHRGVERVSDEIAGDPRTCRASV